MVHAAAHYEWDSATFSPGASPSAPGAYSATVSFAVATTDGPVSLREQYLCARWDWDWY